MKRRTQLKRKQQITKTYSFKWKGVDYKGNYIKGETSGTNIAEIRNLLKAQGITAKRIKKNSIRLFSRQNKITPLDITLFTKQFATMLQAGVPLVTSMELIAQGHEKSSMRRLLSQILDDIKSGASLSEALCPHPSFFNSLYINLVAAGEHSGELEQVFHRLATYLEKNAALKSKVKKAMFYPATIVVVAISVTTILLVMVVPQFKQIFADFGAELPLFTQIIINISQILQNSWQLILGILAISGWGFIHFHKRSQSLRNYIDQLTLTIPIFKNILHKAAIAKFARTLATTFAASVPLIDGLKLASSGNHVYQKALLQVRDDVISGIQINKALRATRLFPDMFIQMVMIGEESGSLDTTLNKIAHIYETQVDDTVDVLSNLIEPIMMVIIGLLVGSLIIGMYLPIFQIGNVVG